MMIAADLRRAVELLTIVPVRAQFDDDTRVHVAGWFPLVGLGIGAVQWGLIHLLLFVGWYGQAALVWAAVLVAFSAWMTRMLHWDGLGDVADAWWGGHTIHRRLEIMSDSALGSFGVTAIALVVVTQVSAIGSIIGELHQLPLLIVPPLARLAATFSAWLGRPARPDGLGRSVMGRPGAAELAATALVVGVCAILGWIAMEYWALGFVIIGVITAAVVPHVIATRMGGVTGDVMGASVVVVEALLYALVAVVQGVWG